jgi:hypothetical protein
MAEKQKMIHEFYAFKNVYIQWKNGNGGADILRKYPFMHTQY